MHKYAPILAAIGLLLLAGCGGSQTDLVSNPEDVIGTWSFVGSGLHFIRFEADGIIHDAPSLDLVTNPPVRPPGEYWFEEDQLHIRTPEGDFCGAMTAMYEVRLLESGNLGFVLVDDACVERARWFQDAEYAPVE